MLVHRDYEIPEKSSIEVQPGTEITFINPGGLTPKLAGKLGLGSDGRMQLNRQDVFMTQANQVCGNSQRRAGISRIQLQRLGVSTLQS